MSCDLYFEAIDKVVNDIKSTQRENISAAAQIIADSIMKGGILQAFGSGHSYAAAIEVCGRAGGLIPSKAIEEPSRGMYETVEGTGAKLMETSDLRENDCLILISNSGRNPLGIEIADYAKKKGVKVIVVTSLESSKKMTSRHSSGKKLYDFADVVLDNRVMDGDASVQLEGMSSKICGTSSIAGALLLNCTMVEAIEIMLSKGYVPPVYMSENVDGGHEFNAKLKEKYADRLYRK